MSDRNEDTSRYPRLGQMLSGIDRPQSVQKIIYALYVICALLVAAEFFYYKKTYFSAEKIPGFYAAYGFFMCAGLVICARLMRIFLMRPEDYYAPKDTDSEPYPEDQLSRETVDD
jgi:hypothetical protein